MALFCKPNHFVADRSWDNDSTDIVESTKRVEQNYQRVLLVKFSYSIEKHWNSFSQNASSLLCSTEPKSWFADVGSDDLNPVCRTSSFVVKLNFFVNLSWRLDIEVIEIGLLTLFILHDFEEGWPFNFLPFFWIILQWLGLWVVITHFVKIYFYW